MSKHYSDAMIRMQLTDLARSLKDDRQLQLEFSEYARWDQEQSRLYVSSFWEQTDKHMQLSGYKSDVLLQAYAMPRYDELLTCAAPLADNRQGDTDCWTYPSFARQSLALLDEMRLEQWCSRQRKGTARLFFIRHQARSQKLRHRMRLHWKHDEFAEAILLSMYLLFSFNPLMLLSRHDRKGGAEPFRLGKSAEFSPMLQLKSLQEDYQQSVPAEWKAILQEWLPPASAAINEPQQTAASEAKKWIEAMSGKIADDCKQVYFYLAENASIKKAPPERLQAEDASDEEQGAELPEYREQSFSSDGDDEISSHLRSQLDDQRRQTHDKSHGSLELSEKNTAEGMGLHSRSMPEKGNAAQSSDTTQVQPIWLTTHRVLEHDRQRYQQMVKEIRPYHKRIEQTIRLSLEKKRNHTQDFLNYGRLGKKWTRLLTEEHPKLFYRKKSPTSKLDAAIALVVDCSASMVDKIEQTRLGVCLLHEVLKTLRIPHTIIGFWEHHHGYSQKGDEKGVPNYFLPVVDFAHSLDPAAGTAITQLEPQHDNRDGYALRKVSSLLRHRKEKQKLLMVFSDGEPAAFQYQEIGIADTQEAVKEARQLGIDTIGIFLADRMIRTGERQLMQDIYGNQSIMVSSMNQLHSQLAITLQRLLIAMIR